MENITMRLPINEKRPLYDKRLDPRGLCAADTEPLPASLVIDPEKREFYTEIDYTPITDLEYSHCWSFEISPYMEREAVVDLLYEIRPLAERLIDAYEEEEEGWVDLNGRRALKRIESICDATSSDHDEHEVWDAESWLGDLPPGDPWVPTASTTDDELESMASKIEEQAASVSPNMYLHGVRDYLERQRRLCWNEE